MDIGWCLKGRSVADFLVKRRDEEGSIRIATRAGNLRAIRVYGNRFSP